MEEAVIFTVEDERGRIDKYIAEMLPKESRSQIQKWIREGYVQVNQVPVKSNYKVQSGDEVSLVIPETEELPVEPENIPLDIVYEDESVLVINKPAGMVVHPSKGHLTGTLVNALLYHVNSLSQGSHYIRPGIVHRIDKDTSGLLVIAKTNAAHQFLAQQFEAHTLEREYTALVHGVIQHEEGTIEAPIARMNSDRKKRTVAEGGKHAITHFKVLERFSEYTLIRLRLETGRTHQIRVHMKYIQHPLAGDPMYGPAKTLAGEGQYLHAGVLGFIHPVSKEFMRFTQPLPGYFEETLRQLRNIH